jgi:hypothetical protein
MEDNTQILSDIYVTLPVPTVPDAETNGGIGYEDVEDNQKGVWVRVGPWLDMHTGDEIRLFWGDPDRAAVTHTVNTEKEAFLIAMPAETIKNGPTQAEVEVWYTLVAFPGGNPSTSASIKVLVDLTVPGGIDPVPATPQNENLSPIADLPRIVGKEQPVEFTVPEWINQEVGDVLTVAWGSFRKKLPPSTQTGAVKVALTAAEIKQGGDDRVPVSYQIRDRVNNWSRWSPVATTNVEIGDRLPGPSIHDADEFDVLHIEDLRGGPAEVHVTYTEGEKTRIGPNDIVTLTWSGQTAEGSAIEPVVLETTVTSPVPRFVRFDVPFDDVAVLAQGNATVSYTVAVGGTGTPLPSARTFVSIVGDVQRLTAPTVIQAVGDTLDPADVPDGATVVVEKYPFIASGDRVSYEMYGQAPGGVIVGDQAYRDIGNIDAPIVFVTPKEKIAALAGGVASFAYRVDNFSLAADGTRTVTSRRMIAPDGTVVSPERVLKISGAVSTLPPPNVPLAEGEWLDPDKVNSALGVQVDAAWPAIAPGDKVTFIWQGSADATPWTDELSYRSGGKVTTYVPKNRLTPSLGGTVTVRYSVAYAAGGSGASQSLLLNVGSAQLVLPAPTVDQASDGELDPFDVVAGITVRVPENPVLKASDQVSVTWRGSSSNGSHTTSPKQGNPAGMTFTVPAGVLPFNFGETVEVTYSIERAGSRQMSQALSMKAAATPYSETPPGYRRTRARHVDAMVPASEVLSDTPLQS